nr:hypothetical protein [uncultured Rhodopila sp.]
MNAVPFDTLKFARKLEASGMVSATAAGTAEALAEAMTGAELATKADIAGTHTAIAGTYTAIANLRTVLKGDIDGLRAEVKSDIELLRRDLVIKLGSIAIVGVGVLLAAMRYMPVHP